MLKKLKACVVLFIFVLSVACQNEDAPTMQTVKLRVSLKFTIDSTTYENENAQITVNCYDESGSRKWSEDFEVPGPVAVVTARLGFHSYVIESTEHGIRVEKRITAKELLEGSVGGVAPTVYELTSTPSTRRLAHYIEYYEDSESGFVARQKVRYVYNEAGRLIKYVVYRYNTYKALEEERYFNFVYSSNLLTTIIGYYTGNTSPFVQYNYVYNSEESVSKISEHNFITGVNSEVNFTYDVPGNSIKAVYSFSNGESFVYDFELINGNVISDKTTSPSGLCSTGSFTYDNKINPFSLLGYTDFNLTNLSTNNRLSEDVNYYSCSFPALVPQSYVYVYDESGYPLVTTTTYKPNSSGRSLKSRRTFVYE